MPSNEIDVLTQGHVDGLDPEVTELVQIMNKLPGIATFESCCGHGSGPFRIWFRVDEGEHSGLFVLTRSVDQRYWHYGYKWRICLTVGDVPHSPLPITYCLESRDFGEEAYDQATGLVENIGCHLRHDAFIERYRLHELA